MSHSAPRKCAGFTIFEVVVVMSLTALALVSLSEIFVSNTNMAEDARALQKAEAAHRRNMEAVCRVLRGADSQTLQNFDGNGVSTNPHFGRVNGADLDDFTYHGDEQLVWAASPVGVDGVVQPGGVYLQRLGIRYLIADRVPAGGFRVSIDGQNMVINLTTYYTTNTRRVVHRTTESVVSMRN